MAVSIEVLGGENGLKSIAIFLFKTIQPISLQNSLLGTPHKTPSSINIIPNLKTFPKLSKFSIGPRGPINIIFWTWEKSKFTTFSPLSRDQIEIYDIINYVWSQLYEFFMVYRVFLGAWRYKNGKNFQVFACRSSCLIRDHPNKLWQ